jgi:hypothetical protein
MYFSELKEVRRQDRLSWEGIGIYTDFEGSGEVGSLRQPEQYETPPDRSFGLRECVMRFNFLESAYHPV